MDRPADRSRKYRHEERPRPGGRHRMGVRQTIDGRFRRAVRRIYRPARQIRRPPGRRTAQRRVVRQLGMQNPDMDAGNGKRIRRTHGLRPAKMDPGPVRLRDRHPGRDRALSERLAEGRRQPLRRKLLRQHGATGPGTRPVDPRTKPPPAIFSRRTSSNITNMRTSRCASSGNRFPKGT